MTDEPFLLVSLEEDKAKALAQVLSNDTARKILDFLSKVDHSTETDISREMKLPLSTAHYNLAMLVKANLVSDEQFTYSEKGKQIIHYSLSNRYVIIAPKKSEALRERLRKFLPVILISTAVSLSIKYLFGRFGAINTFSAAPRLMAEASGAGGVADASMKMAALPEAQALSPLAQTQEIAIWFLFGSVFTLIIYFIWAEIVLKRISKKQ